MGELPNGRVVTMSTDEADPTEVDQPLQLGSQPLNNVKRSACRATKIP